MKLLDACVYFALLTIAMFLLLNAFDVHLTTGGAVGAGMLNGFIASWRADL